MEPKKALKYGVYAIILGMLLIGAAFSPPLNPPQCPDGYTQAQVDASSCIIGANIGAAPIFMLGLGASFAGIIMILIVAVTRLAHWLRRG